MGTMSPADKLKSAEKQSIDPNMWHIHGNAYDLSEFVPKHPGGSFAILSAKGRDCTALFESYHPWNDNHRKILSVYGAKPPPCEALYEEMKQGVRKLFPKGARETKVRPLTVCGLLTASALTMYLFFVVKTVPSCLFAGVLMGLFGTRLSHESGHMQMCHKPWANRLMLLMGYFTVGPSLCWYYRHVISHHPHTNTDHDVDVRYIGLMDLLPSWMKWAKILSIPSLFVGAVAELSIVQMLEIFLLKNVHHNPVYFSVGGLIPEAIVWLAFHYHFGPALHLYACMWLMAGGIFVPMSQISHAVVYPDANLDGSWAKGQMMTSINFAPRSSLWYHLAFGLTTQIEHHLFPGIGAHCLDDIHDHVVKPVCEKHQIPVYDVSAKKALWALWRRLLDGEPVKMM